MKLHIQGGGPVELTQKDYLCSGGEGQIYVKGGVAYKVYLDPKRMIPSGKIQELSSISHPDIIKPESILLGSKNTPVGYTMKFVKDTYSLCQLFTKSFRDRNGITNDITLNVVRTLQSLINHIHDRNILVVDLNELNFLTSQDFKHVYAIDVDSYQTKSFPATAIMDSIRDLHSKSFSNETDWFAFAIVSFQLFVGIHPYKGKHPSVKSIQERMLQNISVLSKDVSIPSACLPISNIPKAYLDWYAAVLERGQRIPPPKDLQSVATLVQNIVRIVGSNSFDTFELGTFADQIIDVLFFNGTQIVQTIENLSIGSKVNVRIPRNSQIVTTPKSGKIVAASLTQGKLKLYNATDRSDISIDLEASALMKVDNRLYVKSGGHLLEVQLNEFSQDIIVTNKVVANVAPQATSLFDGVVFQNLLGACYVSILPGPGVHHLIRMKELDDYRIFNARYDSNVLMVIGYSKGKYNKFIIRFDQESYDVRVTYDISPTDLNFIVLDSGICVHVTEEESVEVFSSRKDSQSINIIDDPAINSEMILFKNGTKVLAAKYNKLFSLTMKKKS